MKGIQEKKRLILILSIIGPLTTIIVSPNMNFDPINPIKLLLVSTFAGGCLGLILALGSEISKSLGEKNLYLLVTFPLFGLLAFLLSDSNRTQQFWGVFGRNTGLLNYLALFSILFAATLVNEKILGKNLVKGLQLTSIFVVVYCLIQIANLDPIKWSAFAPFATLGNVNFSSAFLGLSSIVFAVMAISKEYSLIKRILTFFYLLLTIFIIQNTGSIQGLLIFVIGFWTALSLLIYVHFKKSIVIGWMTLSLVIAGVAGLGFFNQGPLASLLFQQSNTYRFDYWHAGIEMVARSPFWGLGFDSYGDWYTTERGLISGLRTSLGRTSNSAHNIFIDIAVNGGVLLLLSFLVILGVIFTRSLAYVRENKVNRKVDLVFISVFSVWVAYNFQALISINQIGVGIWGWLLTGLLFKKWQIASNDSRQDVKAKGPEQRKPKPSDVKVKGTVSALAGVLGLVFTLVGFASGYVPVSTDAAFRKASNNGSLNEMIDASNSFGANSFIISQTVSAAINNNYPDQASQLTEKLIREFPRDLYAWKIRAKLQSLSESERQRALEKIVELDPFFACAMPSSLETFKKWVFALPSDQQLELAKWWGLLDNHETHSNFRLSMLDQVDLESKLLSLC
jgi:O-antigen ligase